MRAANSVSDEKLKTLNTLASWFEATICKWFQHEGRKLPWRNAPTAYEVWVSEIMLQQTQVVTVIPYYERWMKRFPDVYSLASADIEEVLRYWAGLGYYRRARYLHEGANVIVNQYGGEFPSDLKALEKIPGIGAYTAGAIASFAFKANVPAVDGNAERVLSRFFGISGDLSTKEPRRFLEHAAELIAACGHASDSNQAIMDIGAGCCSKTPQCDVCPLVSQCYAAKNGLAETLPYKKQRIQKYDEFRAALQLKVPDGRYLLARRASNGLLGGLWEFPMITISKGKGEAHQKSAELQMRLCRTERWMEYLNGFSTRNGDNCITDWQFDKAVVSHTFTHIEMRVYLDSAVCRENLDLVSQIPEYDMFSFAFIEEIESQYAISSLMKKLLESIRGLGKV